MINNRVPTFLGEGPMRLDPSTKTYVARKVTEGKTPVTRNDALSGWSPEIFRLLERAELGQAA
ncbi:hypothetical protein [Streptomyces sp. NPDC055085]